MLVIWQETIQLMKQNEIKMNKDKEGKVIHVYWYVYEYTVYMM